jgi:hypothetical protein
MAVIAHKINENFQWFARGMSLALDAADAGERPYAMRVLRSFGEQQESAG